MDIYGKSLGMIHEIGRLPHNPHIFTSPNFHSNLLQSAGRTCTNRMPKTYLPVFVQRQPLQNSRAVWHLPTSFKTNVSWIFLQTSSFFEPNLPPEKNVIAHHPPQRNICIAVPSSRSSYPVSEGSGLVKVPFLQH